MLDYQEFKITLTYRFMVFLIGILVSLLDGAKGNCVQFDILETIINELFKY